MCLSEGLSKKDNNLGLSHPEGTSACLVSCVHFLTLRHMEIPCCLSVWPKSHLIVFLVFQLFIPSELCKDPYVNLTKGQIFGLECPQILMAFPLILTSYWKHQNRLSADVLLRCFKSHSDYSNAPPRHRSSIISAHLLINIGNELLNYTVCGGLKSLPKMAQKVCGMAGKRKDG